MREFVLLVAGLACAARPAFAQGPPSVLPSSRPSVLSNVTLIDGTGAAPRPGMTIVVANGHIADIYAAGTKPAPPGVTVMDLRGRFVIPGLIDAHAHVTGSGNEVTSAAEMRRALSGGVTAVRDMGGDAVVLANLARSGASADSASPRLYFSAVFAGPTWMGDPRARASAHGGTPGEVAWIRAITPQTDLPAVVAAAKATGATAIKIYADLTPDLVAAVTREAHRQGLRVWSHASVFPSRPHDAVAAGVDVISHSSLLVFETGDSVPPRYHVNRTAGNYSVSTLSPELTALFGQMKQQGTILDPTLYIASLMRAQQPGGMGYTNPAATGAWAFAIARRAHELGIPMTAGTDGFIGPNGPNVHVEMELLVQEAGLSPLEAISAATWINARAIGAQDSIGTIAVGKAADLVVLSADPAQDIRNTRQIEWVMKAGRTVRRSDGQ